MNWTARDMGILISMSIAVVMMSFIFPALGMGGDQVVENDFPEYNLSTDKYDFASQFPRDPGAPSRIKLTNIENVSTTRDDEWLHGDTDNGFQISLFNNGTSKEAEAEINLGHYDGGTLNQKTVYLENETDVTEVEHGNYTLFIEYTVEDNENTTDTEDLTQTIQVTIEDQPENTNWYDRVPVVGGVMGAGEQLAGIVGWIGSLFYWLFGQFITIFLNMFFIFYDTIVYMTASVGWLSTTYLNIVTSAPGYAAVLTMVPGMVLMLQFAKLGMVAVDILWIG